MSSVRSEVYFALRAWLAEFKPRPADVFETVQDALNELQITKEEALELLELPVRPRLVLIKGGKA